MDNDNKIARLFLGDELKPLEKKAVQSYDLVEEYAKTKKNRNTKVWLVLAGCFLVVIGATVGVSRYVNFENKKIAININSFSDLNLSGLLENAGRVEDRLESSKRNLRNLEQSKENELKQVEAKKENDLFTLDNMKSVMKASDIAAKMALIDAEYKLNLDKVNEKYDSQIEEAQNKVQELEGKVAEFDAATLSKAHAEEDTLNSQKKLNDLERQRLINQYEKQVADLRKSLVDQQEEARIAQKKAVEEVKSQYQAKIDEYDPKAREKSEVQNKIISDVGIRRELNVSELWAGVDNRKFDPKSFTVHSENPSRNFVESTQKAQKQLENLVALAGRFRQIPMENSIKDYVPAMVTQAHGIAETLAEGQKRMQVELDDRQKDIDALNQQMSQLNSSMMNFYEQIALSEQAQALAINVGDKTRIEIHVVAQVRSLFETEGFVQKAQLRDGRKVVADGTVIRQGEQFYFVPNDPAKLQVVRLGLNVIFVK